MRPKRCCHYRKIWSSAFREIKPSGAGGADYMGLRRTNDLREMASLREVGGGAGAGAGDGDVVDEHCD